MIDYRLKTFLIAAEEQNLTRAGDILGLTQPAVSQHIKALEQYYGADLFEKKGRRLILTQAGEYLKKEGDSLEIHSGRVKRELGDFDGGRRYFSIGATLTVGEFILPRFLGSYKKNHRNRELEIRIGNTRCTLDELLHEKLDIAIVEGPFNRSTFSHELFIEDELVFITAPDSPWAEAPVIELNKINQYPLILRESGSGTREYFELYLRNKDLYLQPASIVMEVGSLSAIKSLCESGMGCSVMSRRAAAKELELGTLVERPFSGGPVIRELQFVYTEKSPQVFVKEFISFCHRYAE